VSVQFKEEKYDFSKMQKCMTNMYFIQFFDAQIILLFAVLQCGQVIFNNCVVISSDGVSRLVSSQDPFLQVLVSNVSGLVSVSKASGLKTLNIRKKWFIKISIIQRYFVCFICMQETTKTRWKNARNLKKYKSEVMTKFF